MQPSIVRRSAGLAITAILVVGAGLVSAAPITSHPVLVPATAGWVDSGVSVTEGVAVPVMTLGYVQTAQIPRFHVPGLTKSASGPEGQTWGLTCGEAYATFSPDLQDQTGPCVLDEAYFGELIGRVGNVIFRIGETSEIVPPASGSLEFTIGELQNTYFDNRGAFTVLFE